MRLIFFIILLIFLIILLNQNIIKHTFTNILYRLGDLILYPKYLSDDRSMLDTYPDSIGVKYILERFPCLKNPITDNCNNIIKNYNDNNYINTNLLINIIKNQPEYKQYSKPFSKDELVLHIRIGDVLCSPHKNFFDSSKTFGQIYAKYGDHEWWNKVKNYIDSNNINTVYLVYGSHTNTCIKESNEYISSIKDILNCKIIEVNKNTADQDLMFCINTKHFITTGGGYGLLIGELVQKNGGNFALKPEERTVNKEDKNNIYFI